MQSLTYGQLIRGNRNFRNLLAGQFISELGNWFNFIAGLGLVRLVSEATLARIFDVQAVGIDQVLMVPARIGMGYGLIGAELPISPNPRACFWGGWGGSVVINDLDAGVTMAYMMNKMGLGTVGDERAGALFGAVYAGLAG